MLKRRSLILSVVSLFLLFATTYSQTQVIFEPVVKEKTFDASLAGDIDSIVFKRLSATEGWIVIEDLEIRTLPGVRWHYDVLDVIFDNHEAGEQYVTVTVVLNSGTLPGFELVEESVRVKSRINRAPGYIEITCENIFVGELPNPVVVRANNLTDEELTPAWIAENVVFHYAQVNHDQYNPDDPNPQLAWRAQAPSSDGRYLVRAVLDSTRNFEGHTSAAIPFSISAAPTAIRGNDLKTATNGLWVIQNPVTDDRARFWVELPNGERAIDAHVVIVDALGNSVADIYSSFRDEALIDWDLTNRNGRKVASGTYLAFARVTGESGKKYDLRTLIAVKSGQ
jgi:hypothetical protein